MPTRREKLKAQAEHLLDHYLRLRGIYAILAPLFHDAALVARLRSGRRAQGANIMTTALLYSYILGVANLARDKDPRTPSLVKLAEALSDKPLANELRTAFSEPAFVELPHAEDSVLDEVVQLERREGERRGAQFDAAVIALKERWSQLDDSAALKSCATMRNQLIAHHQLWHADGSYRPLDVTSLGLKVDDLATVLKDLEACVKLVCTIYRGGDFDFARLDTKLAVASAAFWEAKDAT